MVLKWLVELDPLNCGIGGCGHCGSSAHYNLELGALRLGFYVGNSCGFKMVHKRKLQVKAAFIVIALQALSMFVPLRADAELSYPQAILKAKEAADAVLGRTGTEGCLQGKLMNAMVALSYSCDAAGKKNNVCNLADNFIMAGVPPLAQMDDVSQQFLKLSAF